MLAMRETKKQIRDVGPTSKRQGLRDAARGARRPGASPDSMLFLQRYLGNSGMQSLSEDTPGPTDRSARSWGEPLVSQPPLIQAKLTIGQPNDRYEQEADQVAEAVMYTPEPRVQMQVEKEDENTFIQSKQQPGQTPMVNSAVKARINSLCSGGQPLSESERRFFEPRFGYDFGKVRVHSDPQANETTRALNARAFTIRQHIAFNKGEYCPGSREGQRLLAHELVHVTQQDGNSQRRATIQRLERTPEELIRNHTSFFNLDEETLGETLKNHLLRRKLKYVFDVFKALANKHRHVVAYKIFVQSTDEDLESIIDRGGFHLVRALIKQLQAGSTSDKEAEQIQRVMKILTKAQPVAVPSTRAKASSDAVEVKVITFRTGDLDWVGKTYGLQGHTAISIGGYIYSFEVGWQCARTEDEYKKKKMDDGHKADVQVLKISEKSTQKLRDDLNKACSTGYYAVGGDICSDAAAEFLRRQIPNLKDPGWSPQILPHMLENLGVVSRTESWDPAKESSVGKRD